MRLPSWEHWLDEAHKDGPSANMVYDILYDWREERDRLIKERGQFERKAEDLAQLAVTAHNECESLRATVARLTAERDRLATALRAARPLIESGWVHGKLRSPGVDANAILAQIDAALSAKEGQ